MTYLWAFMPVLFYPSVLFLLSFESVQRHAIYVHAVNWPLFAAYTSPEHYGFEPNSWHTVRLPTSDGTFIGVTHMSSSIPRANRPTIRQYGCAYLYRSHTYFEQCAFMGTLVIA